MGSQCEQLLQLMGIGRRIPRCDGPVSKRFAGIWHNQVHVSNLNASEALAGRTGPQRAVVAEQARFRFRVFHFAGDAPQLPTVVVPTPFSTGNVLTRSGRTRISLNQNSTGSATEFVGRFNRIRKPLRRCLPSHEPIHDHHEVCRLTREFKRRTKVDKLRLPKATNETSGSQLFKRRLELRIRGN